MLFHVVSTSALAQKGSLSGIIVDAETGDPLPGAGVTVEDKLEPDARDRLDDGAFMLQNNIWFNIAAGDDAVSLGEKAWASISIVCQLKTKLRYKK